MMTDIDLWIWIDTSAMEVPAILGIVGRQKSSET